MGFHRAYEVGQRVVVSDHEHELHGEHGQVCRITGAGTWIRLDRDGSERRLAWWRLSIERAA